MHYPFNNIISIVAKNNQDFATPRLVDTVTDQRHDTILDVATKNGLFSVTGTFDELLDFSAELVRAVYSWTILNNHSDWLGDQTQLVNEGANVNAEPPSRQRTGSE